MEEIKAFKVEYKCLNCNKEFIEEYYKGDEIDDTALLCIHLKSHNCTHRIGCPHCRDIKCPCCDSKNIKIIVREPK